MIKPTILFMKENRINDTIKNAIELINKETIANAAPNAPLNPCLLVYLDSRSCGFVSTVNQSLVTYWGKYASYIPNLFYDHSSEVFMVLDDYGNITDSVDIIDVLENLRGLDENIFTAKSKMRIYFIVDTTEISNMDIFVKMYDVIKVFKDINLRFSTMLFFMEDSSIRRDHVNLRTEMKKHLCRLDENSKYDSIVVLSSQLYGDGGSLVGDNEKSNYSLLSSIIMLSNNDDINVGNRQSLFYYASDENRIALTAAYKIVKKPISEIVSVSFYSIISCVVDKLFSIDDDYEIPKEELLETLELNRATGYEFINRSIGKLLQENLPSIKDLKVLPNMPQGGLSIRGAGNAYITPKEVFDYLNKTTKGCWNAFYKTYYLNTIGDLLKNEIDNGHIKERMSINLKQKFTYAQLSRLLESKSLSLIESSTPEYPTIRAINNYNELNNFIIDCLKAEVFKEVKPVIIDVIRQIDEEAERYIAMLNEIKAEFESISKIKAKDMKANIPQFYGQIIQDYLMNADNKQFVIKKFDDYENSESMLLSNLFELFKQIVECYEVYRCSFENELNQRLNTLSPGAIDQLITSSLLDNPDDAIRLSSPLKPRFLKQFFLINEKANYASMMRVDEQGEIINTGSSSFAENIILYLCKSSHLVIDK